MNGGTAQGLYAAQGHMLPKVESLGKVGNFSQVRVVCDITVCRLRTILCTGLLSEGQKAVHIPDATALD